MAIAVTFPILGCGTTVGFVSRTASETVVNSIVPQSVEALEGITQVEIIDTRSHRIRRVDAETCGIDFHGLIGFINSHRGNWYTARVNFAPGARSPEPQGRFLITFWQGTKRVRDVYVEGRRIELYQQGAVLSNSLLSDEAETLRLMLFPEEPQIANHSGTISGGVFGPSSNDITPDCGETARYKGAEAWTNQ